MLVSLRNISKSYGARKVLEGVSLHASRGRHVGLVGANGAGKTTLLRIMARMETPDSGEVSVARGARIGYLEQEAALDAGRTVRQVALSAFDELRELEAKLRETEHAMAEAGDARREALARRHGELLERFERGGGYDHESRTAAVLHGLGFEEAAFDRAVAALSGGERTRLALARLLLRDEDLLLLDEPTNHLDLDGVEWLEQFRARYGGGVIVVCHDRVFLDRVVGTILELESARLETYPGNYTRYVEIRRARRLEQGRVYERQREFIAKEEAFIRRYRAGQRAREARGRQKRLARIERVERPAAEQRVAMRFAAERRSGEVCVRAEGLAVRLAGRTLFEDVRFDLYRGERMGVVGPNGCGKTTLLRAILGHVAPSGGEARLGHKLKIGYYDQLQSGLDESRMVLDEVWEVRRTLNEVDVRELLALFRLTGDDVLKRVGDCSGGERSRVALAKLIVGRPNFLVLDEPTHHLDIASREALEEALREYDGTILAVSHDRYFLNRIVSKLLVFEPARVRLVHGNYALYEELRASEAKSGPTAPAPLPAATAAQAGAEAAGARPAGESGAMSKNRFVRLEARIMELEEERREIGRSLESPEVYSDGDKVGVLMRRRREVEAELAELNAQWDAAAEAM